MMAVDPGRVMNRTVAYWGSTVIASVMLLMSLSYLAGSEQVVEGFAKAGYPQHLRIVLGMLKPAAGLALLVPGFVLLKEWAYAGATFAWMMAFVSAYTIGEPPQIWAIPLVLLLFLAVSYATRPPHRRLGATAASTAATTASASDR